MYHKLSGHYKKRIYNYEDEPPTKKLISDGDIFIKQLAKKQRNTKINLAEQLLSRSQFYKSTEEVSVTNYTRGSKTLEEFNVVIKHSNDIETLKSHGLTDEEIELFLDYQKGKEFVENKHKFLNGDVLQKQIENISSKIIQPEIKETDNNDKNRLTTELILSAKPNSVETKLMKFAIENEIIRKEKLPEPMDQIKDVELKLRSELATVSVKKIRRKARNLSKKIESINILGKAKAVKLKYQNETTRKQSKWDIKEFCDKKHEKEKKIHTCNPLNYYTIKNDQIVKINGPEQEIEDPPKKLTVDEIKRLPKFKNYNKGSSSKTLYLKNLAHKIEEKDLEDVFRKFSNDIISIKIMKGRMQGQAFVEFKTEDIAEKALDESNGTFLKNKPIIVQYGRRKL